MQNLRVVILSDAAPRLLLRLAQRIQNEVPGATICGLIHDSGPQPAGRLGASDRIRGLLADVGNLLLRWVHACPPEPNGAPFTYDTAVQYSQAAGWPICRLDGESRAALDLFDEQKPDLCLAFSSRLPASALLTLPRLGSLIVGRPQTCHRGEDNFKELKEVNVSVSRVQGTGDPIRIHAVSLPLEPYDTATSIALKTDLVGSDLLIQSAVRVVQDEEGVSRELGDGSQVLSYLPYFQRRRVEDISPSRPPLDRRSLWKLFFNSLLLSPYLLVRNWYRRWRRRFPVIILFHHLISDWPHPLGMPTDTFLRMVEFLQKHYRIVSLSEAVELLRAGRIEVPTVALSFDDGYQENFLTLRGVIEATGIPASVFVCTSFVEQQASLPHDRVKGYDDFTSLNWQQVAHLARNGVEIGSHTRTHLNCGTEEKTTLEREIVGAQSDLQQHLGKRVPFFCFPFGNPENISAAAMQLARSNYPYVFSSFGGQNFARTRDRDTHLLRKYLPPGVWALELSLQGVLDLRRILKRRLGWGAEAREIVGFLAADVRNPV